jgi:bifunctional DNA-binding transcriptional regulator/antitoxin component of YhaV-PrlF toxin-antitoxin module
MPTVSEKKRRMQVTVSNEGSLLIPRHLMARYGLNPGAKVTIELREREIHIVPELVQKSEKLLDELAGCLGQERATSYDFSLKMGGLYEAR